MDKEKIIEILNNRDEYSGSDINEAIEEVIKILEQEKNAQEKDTLDLINEMKKKYKMALFERIREDILGAFMVTFGGKPDARNEKYINKDAYGILCRIVTNLDFQEIEIRYKQGKEAYENETKKC